MSNTKKLLNNQELSMFCDQIAMILNAGISAMEGISIMLDDATTEEGRQILQTILDKCNEGDTFHHSVEASESIKLAFHDQSEYTE